MITLCINAWVVHSCRVYIQYNNKRNASPHLPLAAPRAVSQLGRLASSARLAASGVRRSPPQLRPSAPPRWTEASWTTLDTFHGHLERSGVSSCKVNWWAVFTWIWRLASFWFDFPIFSALIFLFNTFKCVLNPHAWCCLFQHKHSCIVIITLFYHDETAHLYCIYHYSHKNGNVRKKRLELIVFTCKENLDQLTFVTMVIMCTTDKWDVCKMSPLAFSAGCFSALLWII